MSVHYLLVVLRCLLVALWLPTIAFASTVTLDKTLEGITFPTMVIVFVLSSLSGATALLQRIDRELRESATKTLPRPTLFAAAHMLGSWLAGCLAFILAENQDTNDWLELGIIVVASFAGAKFIESISEKYLAHWSPKASLDGKSAP